MAYHTIVLAPHLDDAAFSCGAHVATLTRAGYAVLIVTIMAGDPPPGPLSSLAREHHQRWEVAGHDVDTRREEDVRACAILGADYRHGSVPDCIYRRHPESGAPLYDTVAELFGEIHPAEAPLITSLAQRLQRLPAHERLLVPLGIGHHVDHQIVRRAAERSSGPDLLYYEDFPYVQEENALQFLAREGDPWESILIPHDATARAVRVEAVLAYESQLSTFFRDRADVEAQIGAYSERIGGERLWRRLAETT
jgi:LmbE family N-acetylglucosaminyl deacetylase